MSKGLLQKLSDLIQNRIKQGVAEGSLEEIDRRGFLRGLGAAAVAGAAGSAMAQSQPVDVSQAFANMRKDDPRVQHNKDIDEMARAIYDQMVTLRGQPIDRRQQQMWMTIAREKAVEKLAKYAPGRPAAQPQSSGFPSQSSERRVSRNIDNFESQGVAEGNNEKIAGRHDPDDFDAMVLRLKKLAGAGPMQTQWDPKKRVYRNMPTAVQPPKTAKGSQ